MNDLVHNIKVVKAKAIANVNSDTNGATIDSQGFEALTFVADIGTFATFTGSNRLQVEVEQSDTGNSNWGEVDDHQYLGTYINEAEFDGRLDTADHDEAVLKVGVRVGSKRYYRIKFDETGNVNVPISCLAILSSPRVAPQPE